MLFENFFLVLLWGVYGVLSIDTFIEKGQRAELFELMDNEIPIFKVTIPDNELTTLIEKVNISVEQPNINEINSTELYKNAIMTYLEVLKSVNYAIVFPGYDFNEILPDMNIDKDGIPQFEPNEVIEGFDLNKDHYNGDNDDEIILKIFQSNPKFNLFKNLKTLSNLNMDSTVSVDPFFVLILGMFKTIDINDYLKKREEVYTDYSNDNNNNNNNNVDVNDDLEELLEFKTKNATLDVEINGEIKKFEKITLKLAGKSSRSFGKLPFNIKIRGKKDLFGRSQFKLRADGSEPTYLRTKLVSDIHDRLGLTSVSAGYINLYINEQNMGLYILSDAYKPSWVKSVYGEEDTTSLYKCEKLSYLNPIINHGCENENEDIEDYTELYEFLKLLRETTSVSEIEKVFEIDHFLNEMAIDYLLGSYDHLNNPVMEHNFYFYKQPNGKWIYLSFDFDLDFGIFNGYYGINYHFSNNNKKLNIIEVLILKDPTRFEKILKQVIEKVFNPATLYPHIDKLKAFIKPYVELDKTPDVDGNYPGRLNQYGMDFYTMEEWDANSEFTSIKSSFYPAYGLKYWILEKYRFVCQYYQMECDPIYMDKNFQYSINKNVEYVIKDSTRNPNSSNEPVSTTTLSPSTSTISISTTSSLTTTSTTTVSRKKCWSELIGYECCTPDITTIYAHDDYGDWSYDFDRKEWCGLTTYEEEEEEEEKRISNTEQDCWSEKYGYPCCKSCIIYEVDLDGSWGYESNQWCGIPSYCKKEE